MKTQLSTVWSSRLLVAVILFTGSNRLTHAAPGDAATPRPQTSPSQPAAADQQVRPNYNSPPGRQAPATPLSFWAAEVARLAQAGIDDSVILAFLDNVGTVNLGADQIISLTEQGVSRDVISAMLQHDFEIASGWRALPTVTPMSKTVLEFPVSRNVSTNTMERAPAINSSVRSNESAPAATPGNEHSRSANISEDDSAVVFVEFPVWEYTVADFESVYRSPPPASARQTYAVREPYPVPVTAPIILIDAPEISPNVVLLETFR